MSVAYLGIHPTIARFAVAICLCLFGQAAAWAQGAAGAELAASGLLIGLKPGVNEVLAAQVDSGRQPHDRLQSQERWSRAARAGEAQAARIAREAGVSFRRAAAAGDAQVLGLDRPLKGQALKDAVRRLRLHPDVAWVEPDVLVPRLQEQPVVPDDALFSMQWHLQAPDASRAAAMNLPAAWARTTGEPIVVAVVDSGVRLDHPELAGKLLPGRDLISELDIANDGDGRDGDPSDPGDWVHASDLQNPVFAGCSTSNSSWHGTFIAGQIAASTYNSSGIAGLSWGAQVLPVRVSGKCGARLSDLLDGLRWAAGLPVEGQPLNPHPARIINLSFGGDAACSPAYQETIDAVTVAGALVVVAAGNGSAALKRPADCQRVLAVASVQRDGSKASYSSFGANIALSAPGGSWSGAIGESMLTSLNNSGLQGPVANTTGLKQGTSFAAPQAAGVASLMLSINPALTPAQLIERMKAGARPHVDVGLPACSVVQSGVCQCTTESCGSGLLDAERAVLLASGPAAIIDALDAVLPGALITLDGRRSAAVPNAVIVSHRWAQLAGPPVSFSAEDQPLATVQLPTQEAEYRFRLSVTDSEGQTGQAEVRVMASTREALTGTQATGGGGGGANSLLWGAAFWAWVLALGWSQHRYRSLAARAA
jgi:serine protease